MENVFCVEKKTLLYMTPICSFTENFSKVQRKKRLAHCFHCVEHDLYVGVYINAGK